MKTITGIIILGLTACAPLQSDLVEVGASYGVDQTNEDFGDGFRYSTGLAFGEVTVTSKRDFGRGCVAPTLLMAGGKTIYGDEHDITQVFVQCSIGLVE